MRTPEAEQKRQLNYRKAIQRRADQRRRYARRIAEWKGEKPTPGRLSSTRREMAQPARKPRHHEGI